MRPSPTAVGHNAGSIGSDALVKILSRELDFAQALRGPPPSTTRDISGSGFDGSGSMMPNLLRTCRVVPHVISLGTTTVPE
jgi:hypothetical protein